MRPSGEEGLTALILRLIREGVRYKILGAMSNLLIADGCEAVFIDTAGLSSMLFEADSVELGSGTRFSAAIKAAEKCGFSLLPELIGIPGSVGGMIYSNAGAFGAEICEAFISARVFDTESLSVRALSLQDMDFSYRKSVLREGGVLLSAKFKLTPRVKEEIREIIEKTSRLRKKTQPTGEFSLGSVFKRPRGDFAARLIDAAGLRGYRIGDAVISPKHAGFIVNLGTASFEDVISLIDLAKKTVFEKFGVMLEEEIEILR